MYLNDFRLFNCSSLYLLDMVVNRRMPIFIVRIVIVPTVKELLRKLDLGKSVAEFDEALENYFVETETFHALISGKFDIIAGDKGTGKTAIYKILQKRYGKYDALKNVEVVPAFNPVGSPVFQKLGERDVLTEGEYNRLWKAYFLSLVGNWVLSVWDGNYTPSMHQLDKLLKGLDLREGSDEPQNIFSRIVAGIGSLFKWKAAEVEVSASEMGVPIFTPRIEFDRGGSENIDEKSVSVEYALKLLNSSLDEAGVTVWVAVDRLDEAFQGFPTVEVPALRALFRVYLDLLAYPRVSLKLFVRRDLFRRIIGDGFVNLTHVNARKVEVIWDEEDLMSLLCKRIRENKEFVEAIKIGESTDDEVFKAIFPNQVDLGSRKPQTWTWIMRRIRDGNDIKPPRNLIDLISMAQQAQMRREERDGRLYSGDKPIIEPDALRRALGQLSKQRVEDTLFAEAGSNAHLIAKFRDGKAEHNEESLAKTLGIAVGDVRTLIKPLVEIGFLEDIKDTFKVPSLYREGLEITQGKAFEARGNEAGLDEDE